MLWKSVEMCGVSGEKFHTLSRFCHLLHKSYSYLPEFLYICALIEK